MNARGCACDLWTGTGAVVVGVLAMISFCWCFEAPEIWSRANITNEALTSAQQTTATRTSTRWITARDLSAPRVNSMTPR